jgi:aldehyde:ferredoxin oxidoreductase
MDIIPLNVFGIRTPVESKSLGPDKIRLFIHLQSLWSLYNVLDLCIFVGVPEYRMITIEQILTLVNAVTGWDISFWELIKAGEIGINFSRLFNANNGFDSSNDSLPKRMFEPLENGAHKGHFIDKGDFETAKRIYYQAMGWTENGKPTYGKFIELGIADMHPEYIRRQV